MRNLFYILFIFSFSTGFSQESNKKKVLVIPYDRFEFVSEFDLETIAQKNDITKEEVYLLYQKTILKAFEEHLDENFKFIPMDRDLIKPFKSLIKYENGKFRGKNYNAVNLSGFSEKDFEKLLQDHGCDFVIFLTWYDIQKEAHMKSGGRRKRVPYAGHYIDYDVYNLFKQRVVGMGRVKAIAPKPNDLEADFYLLRTLEVTKAYTQFINSVIEQLNNPIQ